MQGHLLVKFCYLDIQATSGKYFSFILRTYNFQKAGQKSRNSVIALLKVCLPSKSGVSHTSLEKLAVQNLPYEFKMSGL